MSKGKYLNLLMSMAFLWLFTVSAEAASPKLVVFFVHGINSTPETFCDFPEMLSHQLNQKIGNQSAVKAIALPYSTKGNEWATTNDFAVEIAARIAQYYHENSIPIHVPYVYVAHSQGGLVGKKYLQQCLMGNSCESELYDLKVPKYQLPQNLNQFITIGTPHHGSTGATFLLRGLRGLLGEGGLLKIFGASEQSTNLNPGSTTYIEDREFAISQWQTMKRRTTFHNIIGASNYDNFSLFSKLGLGRELESDMVVSTTSARQDFHYCVMNSPKSSFQCGKTQLVNKKNVHIIDRKHGPLPIESDKKDMKCVEKDIPHPTLDIVRKIILKGTFGYSRDLSDVRLAPVLNHAIKNFAVDIHVYLPADMQRGIQPKDIKVKARKSDFKDMGAALIEGGINHDYIATNDHSFEELAPTKLKNSLSFYHIGRVGSPSHWASFLHGELDVKSTERKHWYRVEAHGFKATEFEVTVSSGMTSYVKIYLEPDYTVDQSHLTPTHGEASTPSENLSLEPIPIGHFNIQTNPFGKYTSKQIKEALKRHQKDVLGSCVLGAIAPSYPNGRPVEPVRYGRFDESSKISATLIDPLKKQRMLQNYLSSPSRHVRIHGSFKGGGKHRYLVSRPVGLLKLKFHLFWMDAKDVDIVPQEIIDKLDEHNDIHLQDVCKQ